MTRHRVFLISGLLGLGAIAMTLLLAAIGPRPPGPLPRGFVTPVIAYEFARSAAEVEQIFAPAGTAASATLVQAMDRVNWLD